MTEHGIEGMKKERYLGYTAERAKAQVVKQHKSS